MSGNGALISSAKEATSYATLRHFDGRLHDRAHCISVFEKHNAEVIHAIPKERLLVYDAKDGWEPLCRFLGVPVPKTPFPMTNTTEDFQNREPPGQRPNRH